jgi:phage-related protein
MEFTVEFYENVLGRCPLQEFLNELKQTDPDDFAAILAGLVKLRNRQHHRPPLSKPVGDNLFELRHVGKLNTRILYFFAREQRIVAVHGIRNKAKEISKRDRQIALSRIDDWALRNAR